MTTYDFLNYVGVLALLLYNLARFRQHQHIPYGYLRTWAAGRRKNGHRDLFSQDLFWVFLSIVLISAFQYGPAPFVNKLFGSLVQTGANYFGLLFSAPIMLLLYCRLMGVDAAQQIDAVVPAFPLALIFAKLGCYAAGCCGGISWELGLLNPHTQIREFPIQLLEAAIALGLFLFLLKKQKQLKPGTAYPIYLMLYCGIRFFSEFLRSDRNILWIFKTYHFLCIAGFTLGAVGYQAVLRKQKSHP